MQQFSRCKRSHQLDQNTPTKAGEVQSTNDVVVRKIVVNIFINGVEDHAILNGIWYEIYVVIAIINCRF